MSHSGKKQEKNSCKKIKFTFYNESLIAKMISFLHARLFWGRIMEQKEYRLVVRKKKKRFFCAWHGTVL